MARDRPLFTMPRLGHNGRFANQLFQYLAVRLAADQRGAEVQTPHWIGRELFPIADAPVEGEAPVVFDDAQATDPDTLLNSAAPLGQHVEFRGFFQFHSRHYRPNQAAIRRLYTLRPEIRGRLDPAVQQLRSLGRPIVAVHLRRGDYGKAQFFRAPARWYADWLQRSGLRDPIVYLCSESPGGLAGHFAGWQTLHSGLLPHLPPDLAFLMDFHVLTQADALAISNSSFSFMAGMLNERARTFVRPTLDGAGLVPFDPWDAPVLLDRHLRPGEQEEWDAFDAGVGCAGA